MGAAKDRRTGPTRSFDVPFDPCTQLVGSGGDAEGSGSGVTSTEIKAGKPYCEDYAEPEIVGGYVK